MSEVNVTTSSDSAGLTEQPHCSVWFDPADWSRRYEETFFTCAIVAHHVTSDGATAVYDIQCKCADNVWTVQRRFSEFEALLNAVSVSMPHTPTAAAAPHRPAAASAATANDDDDDDDVDGPSSPSSTLPVDMPLPVLPSKTLFHSTDETFLHQRQLDLNKFLFALLGRPKVCLIPQVRAFLELNRKLKPRDEVPVTADDEVNSNASTTATAVDDTNYNT